MRPPLAIYRRMRIARLVRILMVDAMRCHPKNRSTLKRQSCACGQDVFHPLGSFVAAMSKQPMIAHANAETSGHPPQKDRNQECFPGKEKQRRNRPEVKGNHEKGSNPINLTVG